MTQVVIGTAGHIDHGKTTLVKALTGTDTDRLPEEKKRGMTIDLGFAFLTDDITIIDVPGHERFIRNMVAGVSTVQIALVTIAVDDGIMPQTREHIDILNLLRCPMGCIALTKIDLVKDPEWIEMVERDIEEYIKGTFLEGAPIIKVSGETGEGVEVLRSVLLDLASCSGTMKDRGFFRLYVDRVFSIKGFGTVTTGTVVSGTLKVGDEIEVIPGGKLVKVRGLQSHGLDVLEVKIGDRAAINLSGLEKRFLWRGVQLAESGYLIPTMNLGVEMSLLPSSNRIIKNGQRVRIHIGTEEVIGRVFLATTSRKKEMKPGEETCALIRLEKEVAAAVGDPVIIRFYSPYETIGGGKILDVQPPLRKSSWKGWLNSLQGIDENEIKRLYIESSGHYPLKLSEWCRRLQISESILKPQLDKLNVTYFGSSVDPFVIFPSTLSNHFDNYLSVLNTFHHKHPYAKGMGLEELRHQLDMSEALFIYLSQYLEEKEKIVIYKGIVRRADFKIILDGEKKKIAEKVINQLRQSRYLPLSSSELSLKIDTDNQEILDIIHLLKEEGSVIEISRDIWMEANNFASMKSEVKRFFKTHSSMSVGDFKDLTQTTRKHAIPLLEYLDEQQITKREGNLRVLG